MKDILPENLTQCTFDFDVLPQKYCPVCEKWYNATSEFFSMDARRKDRMYPYCKECNNAKNRERYKRKTPLPEAWPEGFRRCTKCKELKQETEENFRFYRSKFHPRCKLCCAAYFKVYNIEHAEEGKVRSHQRYINNIEVYKERSHQRYVDNIDYYGQRNKRYNESGAGKRYRQAHPEVARASNRKRRALKRASGSFTTKQIREQHKRQKGKCYYCHKKVGKTYHIEHVVPLARGGSNDVSNIVIACPTCNMRKQDKLPHEWGEGGRLL